MVNIYRINDNKTIRKIRENISFDKENNVTLRFIFSKKIKGNNNICIFYYLNELGQAASRDITST